MVVSAVFIRFGFRQQVTPAAALRSRIGGQRQRLKSVFILAHLLNLELSRSQKSIPKSPNDTHLSRSDSPASVIYIMGSLVFVPFPVFFFVFLSSDAGVFMGCWTGSFRENLKSLFQLC